MSTMNFTPNQQACIEVDGGNILVSAAAGSGKTAVLTERVIRLLTGENPISADKLIIVTFTVLAADEMRQRIHAKLSQLIELDPTNRALQNQQLLLANAKISTIHSLCSSLIRDNFQKLGLSGDFRIADETELTVIKSDATSEVFDAFYEQEDKLFLELIEFIGTKDDKKLVGLVLSLYDFIRSFAFPKNFLKDTLKMYQNATSIKNSIWHDGIKNHITDALESCIITLTNALDEIDSDEQVKDRYYQSFAFDKEQMMNIVASLQKGDWDKAVNQIKSFEKMALKPIRGYEDKGFLQSLQEKRKTVHKILENTANRYLNCNEGEFLDDINVLTPKLETLFLLVNQVYDVIEEKKQELGVIDYADLEHFTVKLLVNQTENGYEKTEIACELAQNYEQIMIDECQDINAVQNLIFKVLSKDEQNIFMVGDVKQSVYRFRKAMPKLFIDKKNSFLPYHKETHDKTKEASIILEQNFRSRSEVCDTVNFIFSQIMSEEMGEINYNKQESLVPAAQYEPYEKAYSEIHIIDYQKEDDDAKAVVEAHHIGKTIKDMVADGYLIKGKQGMQNCNYRDFAILLRAKKDKAKIYTNELKAMGIPCFSDTTEGYFSEYEITVTLNLLRVIDNPLMDVCLVSVLMSPMFGFDADLITQIRLSVKNVPFYIAVTKYAEQGNVPCQEFLKTITILRQKAATVKTDEIVQEIYDQTDFISLSYAMGNGEQKDANLRLLLTYAKQYEGIGTNGLSGFLRYIDRVVENKQDFSCANRTSQNANTVKIMSIHSSKGLEFPICFLADCGKKFNKMDLNKSYQLNSQLGFSMKINDQDTLKSYSNLPFEAIRLQTEKESISEEMRVLYVALTRAKEKLIMVMTLDKAEQKLERIASSLSSDEKLPAYDVYSATSYADWILSAALRHPSLHNIRQTLNANIPLLASDFKMQTYIIQSTEKDAKSEVAIPEFTANPNQEMLDTLSKSFSFQYENEELTKIPAKLTVTQIAKKQRTDEIILKAEPTFLQKQGLSPAMRGTILHSFMQFADYDKASSNLDTEIARLVANQFITKEHADALNRPKIIAFLSCDLYKRMKNAQKVLREYKFLHFIKAGEVDDTLLEMYAKQEILIQGIADCLIFEQNGIVLVDYKTDYVKEEEVLVDRYFDQLRIYKQAVEQAFHLPVKQCLLYSLHLERQIEIIC